MIASTTEDHFAFLPGFQPETDATISALNYNIGISHRLHSNGAPDQADIHQRHSLGLVVRCP